MAQSRGTIFVMDDDLALQKVIEFALRDAGYDVVLANDGEDGLKKLEYLSPNLVLCDIMMPNTDGVEVFQHIKDRLLEEGIPIIIMTALNRKPWFADLEAEHAVIIHKPFEVDYLVSLIDTSLDDGTRYDIRLIDAMTEELDLLGLLNTLARQSEMALINVSVEGDPTDIQEILESQAINIPSAQHITMVSHDALAAVVPVAAAETSIEQMLDHFYSHPLVRRKQDVVLTFGWAQGQFPSANALIEAVARDFVERRWSQGICTPREPAILLLEPGRVALQRHYRNVKKIHADYNRELEKQRSTKDQHIFDEIDQLTAIINHDLNSGFNALTTAILQISEQVLNLSEWEQNALMWLRHQTMLCQAWQSSIAELGAGRVPQPKSVNIASWLKEHINLFCNHLKLPLDIKAEELVENLLARVDIQGSFVACLHLLLAANSAGASYFCISSHSVNSDGSLVLVFRDDGEDQQRVRALQPDLPLAQRMTLPWYCQNLALLSRMFQQQGMALVSKQTDEDFQVIWNIPGYLPEPRATIKSLGELQREIALLEQEIAQQERLCNLPAELPEEIITEQVQHLLAPYMHELEHNVQSLIGRAHCLSEIADIEIGVIKRFQHLAPYCYLLVRNLALVLQGNTIPVEVVDINEQIHQVLDILGHKLTHVRVSLSVEPNLLPVSISSVEAKQVLMNLIKNSAEATTKEGTIHIGTEQRYDKVVILIRDTGSGISPNNREKIFRTNFSTKGRGTNSGVGLYAVQSIVTRAGGRIRVSSAIRTEQSELVIWKSGFSRNPCEWTDTGTLFQIEFPVAEEE